MLSEVKIYGNRNRTVKALDSAGNKIPMLSGRYEAIKFKLIIAVNSCQPKVTGNPGSVGRIERDRTRYCLIRKKRKAQVEEDDAIETATLIAK